MPDIDLEQLKALEAAATPGPWEADWDSHRRSEYRPWEYWACGPSTIWNETVRQHEKDAAFIAAARTAVPALIAEVDSLRSTLREALELAEEMNEWVGDETVDLLKEQDFITRLAALRAKVGAL